MKYIEQLRDVASEDQCDLTIWDALFNPLYRRATWINITNIFFHDFAGYNIIIIYSHEIFKTIAKASNDPLDVQKEFVNKGVLHVYIVDVVAKMVAVFVIRYVKRRTLLI